MTTPGVPRLIIEWPAPRNGILPGWGVSLYDADTGAQIMTAVRLTVDPGDLIRATATVLADEAGNPVPHDRPAEAGDGIRTVDVEFEVAEMRVKEAAA